MSRRTALLRSRPLVIAASLLSFTLVGVLLYVAKDILIPVALAILLTFLLGPLVSKLDKLGINRVVSVLTVVSLVTLVLAGLVLLVAIELRGLVEELPQYRGNIKEKVATLREMTRGGVFDKFFSTFHEVANEVAKDEPGLKKKVAEPLPVRVVPEDTPEKSFREALAPVTAFTPLFEPAATAGLALILVIFMLIKREDLRNRLVSLTSVGDLTTTTKALSDAGKRISRYLLMQLIVNGSFGLTIGLGLLAIGVPYAVLWGLCAAVLRYIPYIGPWIAALLPLSVSLITSDTWTMFVLVLLVFLGLELVTNNVVEPWLYGQEMKVSEVAQLVTATFWAWLWGPVGLILAAPLTVCVAVLGKYVPALAFLERILGDEPALPESTAYLQRLLARDAHEAAVIVDRFRQKHGDEAVFDGVFVPALSLAREERERGLMGAEAETYILQETRRILGTLGTPVEAGAPSDAIVVGCPSHHEMDELTLQMLNLLVAPQRQVDVIPTRALPSEVLTRVKRTQPESIVITAVAPGGIVQAFYLCKRLRKRAPRTQIIVAYLGYRRNLDRIIAKLRGAGANYITTTLVGARSHLPPVKPTAPVEAAPVSTR